MVKITLSTEEKAILQEYFETSSIKLIRLKAQAISMRSNSMLLIDISQTIFRDTRTIERWIKDFSDKRMASIFSGRVGNEYAAKLTREQKEEVKRVLSSTPSLHGLPKEFWDVPQLKKYVYAQFGVVYESARSYHFLMEFGNLSFKSPDKFNIRRNETLIANRMEEIYGEIIPYLEDDSWEVFVSDETRMMLEAITRKAWLRKGEKTILRVERSNEYQNYLGFLNQKNFVCHVFEIAWGRTDEIIRATVQFLKLYPGKKICIIWDNASCHKSKLLRYELKKEGSLERVHLITFPPYAPDTDPIEHVWNTVKHKLSNTQYKSFEETKQKFMMLTNNQIFPYQI